MKSLEPGQIYINADNTMFIVDEVSKIDALGRKSFNVRQIKINYIENATASTLNGYELVSDENLIKELRTL